MRRFFWLLPLLAAVACRGLFLEAGNAYPCDFSEPPGVRDAVCQPGDVCGTNDVCQKYIYEGPRFEGPASVPVYGPNSGQGAVLHPLLLKDPVTFVTRDLPFEGPLRSAFAGTASTTFELTNAGRVVDTAVALPGAPVSVFPKVLRTAQPFSSGLTGLRRDVVLQWQSGDLSVGTLGQPGLSRLVDTTTPIVGFRVLPEPGGPLPAGLPVAWTASSVGFLQEAGLTGWRYVPVPFDGGVVVDVAGVSQPNQLWLLAMTRDALFLGNVDAGTVSEAESFASLNPPLGARLEDRVRTDRGGRMVAALRRGDLGDVLSTFQVSLASTGPALDRSWPDCRPCANLAQHVEVFAPSISTGVPQVEVLCVAGPQVEALRVVGSIALTQAERCLSEPIEMPLSGARVARTSTANLVQWSAQSGIALGGKHGEVWTGETLATLLPAYLDRVPRDVDTVRLPNGERPLAALTDDYLALQQTPGMLLRNEQANGFHRVAGGDLGLSQDARLLGFVRGSGGWAVAGHGEVTLVTATDAGVEVGLGPTLVTASADPIRDSIGGEGFFATDGGLAALFIVADDSLYFVEDPQASLAQQDEPELLTPDLTPEPSVPIRSLALERTPLGTDVRTDGDDRARGYLVTSRNVYAWRLGGTPARWSSTPLVLAGGQPEEVWFDQPRSALGRVGYSDGQIFSLPGGYELAEALPPDDEGVPPQVLDYENLGGWPVAYANTGVFVAGWDQVNGKLQNRFPDGGVNRPMTWRELTLPDGSRPWMRGPPSREARPGRLFVAVDPQIPEGEPDAGLVPHRLLIFLDDQVIQVASHLRKK